LSVHVAGVCANWCIVPAVAGVTQAQVTKAAEVAAPKHSGETEHVGDDDAILEQALRLSLVCNIAANVSPTLFQLPFFLFHRGNSHVFTSLSPLPMAT
jgi:hypothetical protein